ncbi:MAG TPA: phage holin family protein [Anaerolineae bacterium]|nr:phage holin family protein [Anaerolineae bacterium]
MQRMILRWAINAVAIFVAVVPGWIPGVQPQETSWWAILGLGLVFSLINALLRPLLKFLTCPLIILTLGLFTLVINTALFWLTGLVGQFFNIGFTVDGFWPAFWGGLVVGLISAVLTMLLRDELKPQRD